MIIVFFVWRDVMTSWELARYLIDAKKVIDSLMYIDTNKDKMRNLDLRSIINEKERLFYINIPIVIDNCFNKKESTKLKYTDSIINSIYYERDKNNAHKDIDYKKNTVNSLKDMINIMKEQLKQCNKVCKDFLPQEITIDYVAYDRNLFRFVNMINPNLEDKINELLYKKTEGIGDKIYKVFNDTEEIRNIDTNSDYAVLLNNGITLKEGIQNRQDFCIKFNVLNKQNMWCSINKDLKKRMEIQEDMFLQLLNEIKKCE